MASSTEQLQSHIQSALQCITSPSSPDMIKQAQDALLQYEETHLDEYVLALILMVSSQSNTLRLIAMLTLKSAIVRRWKDKGRGRIDAPKILLSEGSKATVRQALLNLVISGKVESSNQASYITNPNEISNQQLELLSDRQLQTNAASLLSKIARMDLPLKFQDLIPSLVEGMKSYQGIVNQLQQQGPASQQQIQQQHIQIFQTILYNIMNCLEAILAEISTQRLLIDKKFRISLAQQYLETIVECGLILSLQALELFRSVQSFTGLSEEYISQALQYAILTSKVVSHMMLSSFYKLVDEESPYTPVVDQILTLIHSFLSQWLPYVLDKSISTATVLQKPMKELIQVNIDLIVELQESNSIEFMRYLNPFLTLFHSTLMSIVANNNVQSSNQFTVSCIYFLSNVVASSKYSNPDTQNELTIFFTSNIIQSLSATLLQLFSAHIYPNQQNGQDDDEGDDIERVYWQDDSEGFYQYELQRSSDDDVGCASQNLFLALVESSFTSQVVVPWLVTLLQNVASQRLAVEIEGGISVDLPDTIISSALPLPPTNSNNAAVELQLQWDAIFTAAGLVGGSILKSSSSGFNFNSFFEDGLGPCLSLLVGNRSKQATSLPVLHRRLIWLLSCNAHQVNISSPLNPMGMVANTLSSYSDICVKLSAVEAIEALLPYCEDNPSILCSIISPSVPALYKLANESAEVESRSACLDLIANLITYIGVAGNQHALTNDMLNTIVAPLASIWDNSTDQNLLLKRNVLGILSCVASFVGSEQAGVLHPLALPLIDASFAGGEDNAFLEEEALRIWWVFIRLSKTYDPLVGKLYARSVELSRDLDHVIMLMRITQHYILIGGAAFLNEHATSIQSVLSDVVGKVRPRGASYIHLVVEALLISFPIEGGVLLNQSGILKTFTEACACNFFELDSSEPDRVVVLYMTALARICISSPPILQTLLPITLQNGTVFGEEQLIQMYIMKYQIAGNGAHGLLFQKLWSMLLLSFYPPCQLAVCSSIVLGRSNDIFNNFVHVLKNVKADGTNLLSYEIHDEEEELVDIGADIYESLQQQQRANDVVITTSFHEAVSTKMNGLAAQLGDEYQEFLASINSDTLQEIQAILS